MVEIPPINRLLFEFGSNISSQFNELLEEQLKGQNDIELKNRNFSYYSLDSKGKHYAQDNIKRKSDNRDELLRNGWTRLKLYIFCEIKTDTGERNNFLPFLTLKIKGNLKIANLLIDISEFQYEDPSKIKIILEEDSLKSIKTQGRRRERTEMCELDREKAYQRIGIAAQYLEKNGVKVEVIPKLN